MTRTVQQCLAEAARALNPITDTPRLDSELLMAHALGISRETLLLGDLHARAPAAFIPLLNRRMAHEPLAYITGSRDFWTISLHVLPGVLIPRPDSETLIEAAIDHFGRAGPKRVLDLGTGSGALLLAALAHWPETTGLGIDASPVALAIAQNNADHNGLSDRVKFTAGDWGGGISERFDLVLCNPPYVETTAKLSPDVVEYEPSSALFAGPEGLDDYRQIIPQLPALIAPGGIVCLEIGCTQAEAVSKLAVKSGLNALLKYDLAGHPRCLVLSACADA